MAKARHLLLLRRYSAARAKANLPLPSLRLPLSNPVTLPKTLTLRRRLFCSDDVPELYDRTLLLTEKPTSVQSDGDFDDLRARISALVDDLLAASDAQSLAGILDSRSAGELLRRSPNGFVSVELLSRLKSKPLFALEVFNWRRKQSDTSLPILAEEYSKAITLAGRAKNVDLAAELFYDAQNHGIKATCIYNALMTAYMYNVLIKRSISVFEALERDSDCKPTIVTYNILLSIYGRSTLVERVEPVLQIIDQSDDISPNLTTYNTVIAAYVTAQMWDRMESTFARMEAGPIKPDSCTHLLMLRGYAHSGNLEKMEKTCELVKEWVNSRVIRMMIWAYCKSSDPDRVQKIEALTKLLPEEEYSPWLNVLLIRVYAQEGLVESMEQFISKAFDRNTTVSTFGIMRSIISGYFQHDAIDRLVWFVRKAEDAGWRLCRSLYHCQMVMYGRQNRLEEMHGVLDEMEIYKINRTKKTFLIMFKAYSKFGRKSEAESIIGMMWKHGFGCPNDAFIL